MAKTEVRFVTGFDGADGWAGRDYAKKAGLGFRFAVVQDTCRPDSIDMFFDEALWLSLLDYALTISQDIRICVDHKQENISLLDFYLGQWLPVSDDDKDPPQSIMVYEADQLTVMIDTEYWCRVGGPSPYHDSYTYAIYSTRPLNLAVMEHLTQANTGGWDLEPQPITNVRRKSGLSGFFGP